MRRGLWFALIAAMVGLLAVGCRTSGNGSPSAQDSGAGKVSATGDAKDDLLAALTRMDGLKSYKAEQTMGMSELPGGESMAATSEVQVDVAGDVFYMVTEVSGPGLGGASEPQEVLVRGSERLMRSSLYSELYGGSPDTWYRIPASLMAGEADQATMVSMYLAPATQAITSVVQDGTRTVRGTEVTVYRVEVDSEKLLADAAGEMESAPGGDTVFYGVGPDGYVHYLSIGGSDRESHTMEIFDYNSALSIPTPTDIQDMPEM